MGILYSMRSWLRVLVVGCACWGVVADHVTEEGCNKGYWGEKCESLCESANCKQFPNRHDDPGIVCDKEKGLVIICDECAAGFWGPTCDEHCAQKHCDSEKPLTCDQSDGRNLECTSCQAGFAGKDCTLEVECEAIEYPENGKSNCPNNQPAAYDTTCLFTCGPGYSLKGKGETVCRGLPPLDPVGFNGAPKQNGVYFLAGKNGWSENELCLFLGHGPSLGNPRVESRLLESIIGLGGQVVRYEPPVIGEYFIHIECLGVTPLNCSIPDLSSTCVDKPSCLRVEHFLDSCTECYAHQSSTFQRNEDGKTEIIKGGRRGNCTTANGDSAPSWYHCDRMFQNWCKVFPESKYCDHGVNGKFYAPNPCENTDCSLRGTCNQHTGQCDCQWAYAGDSCETTVSTTLGHWSYPTPVCEAAPCLTRKLNNQEGKCVGMTGDVCIPQPKPGYVCRGQLQCMPDGAFHGEAQCVPKEKCGGSNGDDCHDLASCRDGHCQCFDHYWGDGVTRCALWDECLPGQAEIVAPTATNNRVCADVNECQENNGGCQQKCRNLNGTYECYCEQGFILADDGKVCKRQGCHPALVKNAKKPCQGVFEDECVPDCAEGFEPIGSLVCGGTGTFVGTARCRGQVCEPLVVPNGDEENPCTGTTGESCVPSCKRGYTSQGYLHCNPPNFTGTARCTPNECGPLAVTNALNMCEGRTGEACHQLECAEGFLFRGSAVCEPDGTWKGLAVCENINECEANQGRGVCEHICVDKFGSFECRCEMGYTLAADGRSCIPGTCELLTHPLWQSSCKGVIGESCTPAAKSGYQCSGTLTCRKQVGSNFPMWEGRPTCLPLGCEKRYIDGAKAPCTGTTDEVCTPVGAPGYTCTGTAICNPETGLFEGDARCMGVKCGAQIILNGDVCVEKEVGEVCDSFFCQNGFSPIGHLMCVWSEAQQAAIWVGAGTCRRQISCDKAGTNNTCGPNAECKDFGYYGGVCECSDGYWGDGEVCKPHTTCPAGQTQKPGSATATQNAICIDLDECNSRQSPCDPNFGICMNVANGYLCGCVAGHRLADMQANTTCVPLECQPVRIQGAKQCTGTANTVFNMSEMAESGYECTGTLTCDPRTLNFQGHASCKRLPCAPYKAPHALNECNGVEGAKCPLLCEYGFLPTGRAICKSGQFTPESCRATSQITCQAFGFPVELPAGVCGDRDGVLGCPADMTFGQASEFCRGEGARLCTLEEVQAGFVSAKSEGECSKLNHQRIWTGTVCGPNAVYTQAASPEFADYEQAKTQCTPLDDLVSTKCCADVNSRVPVDVCTEMYNKSGCSDLCFNSENSVGGYFCGCSAPFHKLGPDAHTCILECPSHTRQIHTSPFCIPSHNNMTRYISFGGNQHHPLYLGKFNWEAGSTGECSLVPFDAPFAAHELVHVQVTPVRDESSLAPFVAWVESVDPLIGFRVCLQQLGPDARGPIKHVELHWMAYTQLPEPAQSGEISLAEFTDADTSFTAIPHVPHFQEVSASTAHVHVTINHRFGGVSDPSGQRGESKRHNGITAWVERVDERGFEVGVEEVQKYKPSWQHAKHANVDYLVFQPWATMKSEGVVAGVANMASAKPLGSKRGQLGAVLDTSLQTNQVIFSTTSQDGLCVPVDFRRSLGSVPFVFATVTHRQDGRVSTHHEFASRHNGLVAWVEKVTTRGMLACYKDLTHYVRRHGGSIEVDWLAIV
eukprot:c32387_g1_i1.p1 GENE.c32387_g1_i1~~c32387_g1_i1.p1  ORF type:complete len:1702 (+),score=174.03 c32387_g1_i1:1-5106(+)